MDEYSRLKIYKQNNSWMSFWMPGIMEKQLLHCITCAVEALEKANLQIAVEALEEFVSYHQHFPLSLTDGAPLAYGQNIKDIFNNRLNVIIQHFSKELDNGKCIASNQILISELYTLVGHYHEALTAATLSVKLNPKLARAYYQMGRLKRIASEPDDAIKNYFYAIECDPNQSDYFYAIADLFLFCGRDDEAVDAYHRTIDIDPKHARAYHGLCWALRRLGRLDEAIEAGRKAVKISPNSHTFYHLTYSLLSAGKYQESIQFCNTALAQNPMDPAALAFLSTALNEIGKRDEAKKICDFENLLKIIDIKPPEGYDTLREFNCALVRASMRHPTRIMDPTQTTNLFLTSSGPFAALKKTLSSAVQTYYNIFPKNSDHPFLSQTMSNWTVDGWATLLKTMGDQEHHFHKHAWLSGVYYAQVPSRLDCDTSENGWIEFCRFRSYAGEQSSVETVTLKPEEGMMVLFPSYFYHRVLPFNDDNYRVSIAFNFIPEY